MPQSENCNPFSRETLKQFLVKHYKHDRLYGRGEEYGDVVVASRCKALVLNGFDLVSQFESITGEAIYFRANSHGEMEECAVKYAHRAPAEVIILPSSCDFKPPVTKRSYPCP
jgi:hypothetical protein